MNLCPEKKHVVERVLVSWCKYICLATKESCALAEFLTSMVSGRSVARMSAEVFLPWLLQPWLAMLLVWCLQEQLLQLLTLSASQ